MSMSIAKARATHVLAGLNYQSRRAHTSQIQCRITPHIGAGTQIRSRSGPEAVGYRAQAAGVSLSTAASASDSSKSRPNIAPPIYPLTHKHTPQAESQLQGASPHSQVPDESTTPISRATPVPLSNASPRAPSLYPDCKILSSDIALASGATVPEPGTSYSRGGR